MLAGCTVTADQRTVPGWDLAQLSPPPMQHPSANTPPPQPPLQLSAPPPPPKHEASKDARAQKLCMRDALVTCPDERSRSCTRKEIVACD